eukprot:m.231566 g.231566  ORF g.231566 m.231566 type:complete len:50 (+) comp17065_c0_seq3:1274-1423(+)
MLQSNKMKITQKLSHAQEQTPKKRQEKKENGIQNKGLPATRSIMIVAVA